MLIGVAGQMQSGKDTVAKIIQSLDCWYNQKFKRTNDYSDYTDIEFVKLALSNRDLSDLVTYYSSWEKKAFADKLKEVLSVLFNCTIEELHDINFKNSPLPDIWQTNTDNILTYRHAHQIIGTELFRDRWNKNTWVNATLNDYKMIENGEYPEGNYSNRCSLCEKIEFNTDKYCRICRKCWITSQYPDWIIADCRFLNEIEAIKERGGYVIKIERDMGVNHTHPSEIEQNEYNNYDFVIDNNGTINYLVVQIKTVLLEIDKIHK
jgi:hypothetical protein